VFGVTNPFTQDGASLDLVLRVVDALPPAVPTIDLRTPCFTLEIVRGPRLGTLVGTVEPMPMCALRASIVLS
jgi:hypothetical protein